MELYIIGNGFDINNGLPTRYSDFSKWVKSYDKDDHAKISDLFSLNNLWSEFEDKVADSYKGIEKIYLKGYDDFPMENFKDQPKSKIDIWRAHYMEHIMLDKIVNNIKLSKLMELWIVDVLKTSKPKNIYTDKHIINFNYTNYIKGNHILHIHESITTGMSLQVGHSENKLLEKHFTRTTREDFNDRYPDKAVYFNKLTKFSNVSVQKMRGFIGYKKITKLIFFGFAFGNQDISYFKEFDSNTPVEFYLEESNDNRKTMHNVRKLFNNITFQDGKEWDHF